MIQSKSEAMYPGYERLHKHTLDLCKRLGIDYEDVQTLDIANDPTTFDRMVTVTFKSGEKKRYRL